MNTYNGKILKAEQKTAKSGRVYSRIEIQADEGGAPQWYTYFGVLQPNSEGAAVVYTLDTTKDGSSYVEDYHVTIPGAPGSAPAPSTNPQQAGGIGPGGHSPANKQGGSRDLWIFAECVYQHAIAAFLMGGTESYGTPSERERLVRELVSLGVQEAIRVNEIYKTYDEKGASAALNRLQGVKTSTVTEQVESIAARATTQHSEFDDDIPF